MVWKIVVGTVKKYALNKIFDPRRAKTQSASA